jgi:hypothetical protein
MSPGVLTPGAAFTFLPIPSGSSSVVATVLRVDVGDVVADATVDVDDDVAGGMVEDAATVVGIGGDVGSGAVSEVWPGLDVQAASTTTRPPTKRVARGRIR